MDDERAILLAPDMESITSEASVTGVLILRPTSIPAGMESYHDAIVKHTGAQDILNGYPIILPEDNCIIMFTSGMSVVSMPSSAHASPQVRLAYRKAY